MKKRKATYLNTTSSTQSG